MSTNEIVTGAGVAIDWLERIAGDRHLLETLPVEDRQRLHRSIAELTTIDPRANRKRRKAVKAAGVSGLFERRHSQQA